MVEYLAQCWVDWLDQLKVASMVDNLVESLDNQTAAMMAVY
jgi:hypothetical protein